MCSRVENPLTQRYAEKQIEHLCAILPYWISLRKAASIWLEKYFVTLMQ